MRKVPDVYEGVAANVINNLVESGFQITRGGVDYTQAVVNERVAAEDQDLLEPMRVAFFGGFNLALDGEAREEATFQAWLQKRDNPELPKRYRRCQLPGEHEAHQTAELEEWDPPGPGEPYQAQVWCKGELREEDLQW